MALAKNMIVLLIVLQVIMAVTGYQSGSIYDHHLIAMRNTDNDRHAFDVFEWAKPPTGPSFILTDEDPEDDEETRQKKLWQIWMDCKSETQPRRECSVYYEETVLKHRSLMSRLRYYYRLWDEIVYSNIDLTTASKDEIFEWEDKNKRLSRMRADLYPWPDIHDMCTKTNLSEYACYGLIENVRYKLSQPSRRRKLKPEASPLMSRNAEEDEDCELEVQGREPKDEL